MSTRQRLSRRTFLTRAALAAAAPWIIPASALGKGGRVAPSERIIVGVIGAGGRGTYDRSCLLAEADTQIVGLCDVRGDRRRAAKASVDAHYGNTDCVEYIDMMEMLARPDIDAVVMAIGDRWHTLAASRALLAGKDVYCEKPCSLSIHQSRHLLEVARRTGRVFQIGTQRRSEEPFIYVRELALQGYLGKLHDMQAHLWPREVPKREMLPKVALPPREELEWDMFLGPAPALPYNPAYLSWNGRLDMWGGCITEWGSHTIDLCQWGAGIEDQSGVEYEFTGDATGDGMIVHYRDGLKMLLTKTGTPKFPGSCGFKLEGSEGWANASDGQNVDVYPKSLFEMRKRLVQGYLARTGRVTNHMRDFLDSVRTRRPTVTGAETMHRTHLTVHAATIAAELGRNVKFDFVREEFPGDPEANSLRSRLMRSPYVV